PAGPGPYGVPQSNMMIPRTWQRSFPHASRGGLARMVAVPPTAPARAHIPDITGSWRNPARLLLACRLARRLAGAISAKMTQTHPPDAFPALEHDHDRCLEEAMTRARKAFDDKGLKLTPLRRAVFGEIASSHRAIGAYEVLDKLAARGERLAPISVYRAIDALLAAGMVHRFESRNAFFACH